MSEIKVNKISPATGTAITLGDSGDTFTVPSGATFTNSGTATGFGGGLCLQVVGMSKTDTTSYASTSYADVSGMSLAITPTKASSKILLFVNLDIGAYTAGVGGKIQRDIDGGGYSDLLVGDASGSRIRCTWHFRAPQWGTYSTKSYSTAFLDSPSYTLTDVITYKILWSVTGGNTVYLNRSHDGTDTSNYPQSASTMTAMEID